MANRPEIPAPERNIEAIEIPGRSGSLIESDGEYKDIEIPIKMNFVVSPNLWGEQFRAVKKWILGKSGKLKFSDDASIFYFAKNVTVDSVERAVRESGEFTATFLCDPHAYIEKGSIERKAADVKYNPYDTSCPKYIITGEGMCTLTVNGKSMTANIGQNLTIDTDLMIAYRKDGTMQNTAVAGNYEDLYLREGDNEISITKGFELSIIPNWRCL